MEPSLVLASNSPRRRELLALTGWQFEVCPAEVDETPLEGEEPAGYVQRLAKKKAERAGAGNPGSLVIAADTTVEVEGQILGKPGSADEAEWMLRLLRGRGHQVHTGISVLLAGRLYSDLCTTQVPMRGYTDAEMAAYIASGDPLDKAGAYAIQHAQFHPVETLAGCYASVMGLPLCHLLRTCRLAGSNPPADVPQACQRHLQYACPVSAAVLQGRDTG